MGIDQEKVKRFWDERANSYNNVAFESVVNLELDPDNLALKIQLETEKVFDYIPDVGGQSILDLGAGVGQWAFRFSERGADQVVAVEYSSELVRIGRTEANVRGIDSVEFVVSPAEQFTTDLEFDTVFISGLFVYLNDQQAEDLSANLPSMTKSSGRIVLRDGTSLGARYEINESFSEHLQTDYSAIYRTREEYEELFFRAGFQLVRDENVFYEGCPLNKYSQTRLRIYEFRSRNST